MIKWLERNYILSWIITVFIAIGIFYISSISFGPGAGAGGSNINAILYHILAFFFLGLFLMVSLVRGKRTEFIFLAFLLAVLYGISDEIHQYFVPDRYASINDIFLNSVGILFAFMIYSIRVLDGK